jgi:hypothetical protein
MLTVRDLATSASSTRYTGLSGANRGRGPGETPPGSLVAGAIPVSIFAGHPRHPPSGPLAARHLRVSKQFAHIVDA